MHFHQSALADCISDDVYHLLQFTTCSANTTATKPTFHLKFMSIKLYRVLLIAATVYTASVVLSLVAKIPQSS